MSQAPASATLPALPIPADQPGSRRWLLIMGAVVATGPMAIDMYLPALPTLQAHFHSDPASTQLTLAAFFAGLAIGQLVYGPVSDRVGRKPPLLVGLAIFTLASLGCIFAPSMEALIALRFLQAVGGCAGMTLTRAMLRDRFAPNEMARMLSLLVLILGVAPILAPSLGGQILLWFDWQALFAVLVVFGLACFAAVALGVAETHFPQGQPLGVGTVALRFIHLLGHRRFMGYALAGGVAQGGMYAYIATSAFVFIEAYHLSPTQFAWLFGANAFGLIAASQLNRWLLQRFPAQRVLRRAVALYLAASLALLYAAASGFGGLAGIILPLWLCVTSLGFTFPNSIAAAMAPFGDRAGQASALLGTLQFGMAGLTSALAGSWYDGSAVPMAAIIASCGLASNLLLRFVAQRR